MENWIWIVIASVFFWLMMRHGGCGRMAHGGHGGDEASDDRERQSDPAGLTGHDHAPAKEAERGPSGRRKGGGC